jgi:hypothetical protein
MRVTVASEPGSPDKPNEDYAATAPGIVVVMDGQTSRTGTGCIHGVPWFAQHVADSVIRHAELGLTEALRLAIAETSNEHRDTCDLSHPGTPSAAVGIVREDAGELRYLVLGDVTLLLDTVNGLQVVSDLRVRRTALAERAVADAMTADHPEKPAALVRMKHAELAARNTPGGFWVASVDPAAADHALTSTIPLADVRRIAVLTDGAARVVDPFKLTDWAGLLDILGTTGPAGLIRAIRETEATDPHATKWPRNKLSDDATAAYGRD